MKRVDDALFGRACANRDSLFRCKASLDKASSAVAVAATATANSGTGSGSGSESSGNAAPGTMPSGPVVTLGNMVVGLYVLVAMGAGAAMVAL